MYIATQAWKEFMNTYLAAINAPMDNDYGQPAAQYITAKSASSTLQQKTTQTQSQTEQQTEQHQQTEQQAQAQQDANQQEQ